MTFFDDTLGNRDFYLVYGYYLILSKNEDLYIKYGKYGLYAEWGNNRRAMNTIKKSLNTHIMIHFIRQLFRDKSTAAMLLISSLIIGICALAPALFVIIVLSYSVF